MLTIESLKKMPFASIDLHFASYIQSLSKSAEPGIFAAAAIASAAVRLGHTCCDLNHFSGLNFSDFFRIISSGKEEFESEYDAAFPT